MRMPARYAIATKTGTSVTAVPRSGSLAMSRERKQRERRADHQIAPLRLSALLPVKLGEHEGDADLGELRRLKVEHLEGIQRRAPICTMPKNRTYTSTTRRAM